MVVQSGLRPEEIKQLTEDLAVHIYCNSPRFARESDVGEEMRQELEQRVMSTLVEEKLKPKNILDKIVHGKVRKLLVDEVLEMQSMNYGEEEVEISQILKMLKKKYNCEVDIRFFNIFKQGSFN